MANRKRKAFELPYIGIEKSPNGRFDILYGEKGDYSAVLQVENPVLQYGGDPRDYEHFHDFMVSILKVLGEGYVLQKQDILTRKKYRGASSSEYLQKKYDEHFEGRIFTEVRSYLVITRKVKRGTFYTFDQKDLNEFTAKIEKVKDSLRLRKMAPEILAEKAINCYILRVLSMEFSRETISLNNLKPRDRELSIGDRVVRSISLVDADSIDLPGAVSAFTERNDKPALRGFPVDSMTFLLDVPAFDTIIYNQVIEVPAQGHTIQKLETKKNRHGSFPDPANQTCIEDIDAFMKEVAENNQLLVNAHFNIVIRGQEEHIEKSTNYIENALFNQGIIPSKNAYNQLELFRSVLPGNGVALQHYDQFMTTGDAAACFFFSESLMKNEQSIFTIQFTDRQGVPVAIDPAELPFEQNRVGNWNKFVLGPTGAGKSFFMNALLEQYMRYDMDIVIVDIGHSYSGLCSYYNGKYITYTEENPITMNPFEIDQSEYNIEKKEFLCTLIGLLWKNNEGKLKRVELDVIANVIAAYYSAYFYGNKENGACQVKKLDFNSFYEFAMWKIPLLKKEERISDAKFDLAEFSFVLKKFYRGGEYEQILNEAADHSLFSERFIVFEIDSIKEHQILSPIVTLVIMDLFNQKMRYRDDIRKALVIEEAWKAIASELMGSYIKYLFKTVRKFLGEVIVVTQELKDLVTNTVVKNSIVECSAIKILLDQSLNVDNFDDVATMLSIGDVERRKLFTINQLDNTEGRGRFKEVYIKIGNTGQVYGVEVSLAQYLTYTTHRPEKIAVERYTNHFGSYPEGLEAFIGDMQTDGFELPAFIRLINDFKVPIRSLDEKVVEQYAHRYGSRRKGLLEMRNAFKDRQCNLQEFYQMILREAEPSCEQLTLQ